MSEREQVEKAKRMCDCGHRQEQHYKGKGMCEVTRGSGFICSCSKFKLPKNTAGMTASRLPAPVSQPVAAPAEEIQRCTCDPDVCNCDIDCCPCQESKPESPQAEGALEEAYEVGKVVGRVLTESQPSSLAGNDNHFLYASQYAGVTFDQAAAVAVALVNKGWNAARQQSQPVISDAASETLNRIVDSLEARADGIEAGGDIRVMAAVDRIIKQSQPVIEPLVEVVQKLVDTNFWHPFSLPLSRAQQDIINMANNALQQFRKAQKERSK